MSSDAPHKRWKCPKCDKQLCSKRSFTEHLNTHNRKRPYTCTSCDYAAASNMTLRRHILRNHTPKNDWGYQCPYCCAKYMEPASYQQHVMTMHFGHSATFGCSVKSCKFTTLCARHFRDHLKRHNEQQKKTHQFQTGMKAMAESSKAENHENHSPTKSSIPPPAPLFDPEQEDLREFVIDDAIGNGFGKRPINFPPKRVAVAARRDGALTFQTHSSMSSRELDHARSRTASQQSLGFKGVARPLVFARPATRVAYSKDSKSSEFPEPGRAWRLRPRSDGLPIDHGGNYETRSVGGGKYKSGAISRLRHQSPIDDYYTELSSARTITTQARTRNDELDGHYEAESTALCYLEAPTTCGQQVSCVQYEETVHTSNEEVKPQVFADGQVDFELD